MTHSNRTLMILAGIGLLIGSAVLVTVKTNIGWGQTGQDASSNNAGAHGPKISERQDVEPRFDYATEINRLIESDIEHVEKTKRLIDLMEKLQSGKEKWILYREGLPLSEDDINALYEDERQLRWLLTQAVEEWYSSDSEELISYSISIPNVSTKTCVLGLIVSNIIETDFEKALELAKLQPVGHAESYTSHHGLYEEAASRSPDDFLRVYNLLNNWKFDRWQHEIDMQFINCDYGKDYDYGELLNNLANIEKSLPEGMFMPVKFSGILSSWTKYDPDAAYAWLKQGRRVEYNSDLIEYIEGYASNAGATPQRIGAVLAEWVNHRETQELRAMAFRNATMKFNATEVIDAYFDKLEIEEDRDEHLKMFLEEYQKLDFDDPFDPFYDPKASIRVLNAMGVESRMTYILDGGKIEDYDAERTIALFKDLGHSDEDIKRLENHFSKAE